jgi:hypothetical protein
LAGEHGRIELAAGSCVLQAGSDTLVMRVTANDERALAGLEDVVARHLLRFAFRDQPEVQWTRVGP